MRNSTKFRRPVLFAVIACFMIIVRAGFETDTSNPPHANLIRWQRGIEHVFSYNATITLGSLRENRNQLDVSHGLRFLCTVKAGRVDAVEENTRISQTFDELVFTDDLLSKDSYHVIGVSLENVRMMQGFRRRGRLEYRQVLEPSYAGEFQFMQKETGEIMRVFFPPLESKETAEFKKGVVRSFHTLIHQENATEVTEEHVRGARTRHRYTQERTRDHLVIHQTRASPRLIDDRFKKQTMVDSHGLIKRVVQVDHISHSRPVGGDQPQSNYFHQARRATHFDHPDQSSDDASSVANHVAATSGNTVLTYRFSRRHKPTYSRTRQSVPLMNMTSLVLEVNDPASLFWIQDKSATTDANFWRSQVQQRENCVRSAPSLTHRTKCWMAMSSAISQLSPSEVASMFTLRRGRAEGSIYRRHLRRQSFVDPHPHEVSSRAFLDAVVASKHRDLAESLLVELVASAPALCRKGAHSLLEHAILAFHSIRSPTKEIVTTARALIESTEMLVECTPNTQRDLESTVVLAYGSLAHAADDELRFQIQTDLAARIQRHSLGGGKLAPRGLEANDSELQFSTLLHALGNSGPIHHEHLMTSYLNHESHASRSAAVFGLRKLNTSTSYHSILLTALSDGHLSVRQAAIDAFLHRHSAELVKTRRRAEIVEDLDHIVQQALRQKRNSTIHRKRGVVSDTVDWLESKRLYWELTLGDPVDWSRKVGNSLVGVLMSAIVDNSLALELSPFRSAIDINLINKFSATSAFFSETDVLVDAQFCLTAHFGYNVNTRLLRQLAAAEDTVRALLSGNLPNLVSAFKTVIESMHNLLDSFLGLSINFEAVKNLLSEDALTLGWQLQSQPTLRNFIQVLFEIAQRFQGLPDTLNILEADVFEGLSLIDEDDVDPDRLTLLDRFQALSRIVAAHSGSPNTILSLAAKLFSLQKATRHVELLVNGIDASCDISALKSFSDIWTLCQSSLDIFSPTSISPHSRLRETPDDSAISPILRFISDVPEAAAILKELREISFGQCVILHHRLPAEGIAAGYPLVFGSPLPSIAREIYPRVIFEFQTDSGPLNVSVGSFPHHENSDVFFVPVPPVSGGGVTNLRIRLEAQYCETSPWYNVYTGNPVPLVINEDTVASAFARKKRQVARQWHNLLCEGFGADLTADAMMTSLCSEIDQNIHQFPWKDDAMSLFWGAHRELLGISEDERAGEADDLVARKRTPHPAKFTCARADMCPEGWERVHPIDLKLISLDIFESNSQLCMENGYYPGNSQHDGCERLLRLTTNWRTSTKKLVQDILLFGIGLIFPGGKIYSKAISISLGFLDIYHRYYDPVFIRAVEIIPSGSISQVEPIIATFRATFGTLYTNFEALAKVFLHIVDSFMDEDILGKIPGIRDLVGFIVKVKTKFKAVTLRFSKKAVRLRNKSWTPASSRQAKIISELIIKAVESIWGVIKNIFASVMRAVVCDSNAECPAKQEFMMKLESFGNKIFALDIVEWLQSYADVPEETLDIGANFIDLFESVLATGGFAIDHCMCREDNGYSSARYGLGLKLLYVPPSQAHLQIVLSSRLVGNDVVVESPYRQHEQVPSSLRPMPIPAKVIAISGTIPIAPAIHSLITAVRNLVVKVSSTSNGNDVGDYYEGLLDFGTSEPTFTCGDSCKICLFHIHPDCVVAAIKATNADSSLTIQDESDDQLRVGFFSCVMPCTPADSINVELSGVFRNGLEFSQNIRIWVSYSDEPRRRATQTGRLQQRQEDDDSIVTSPALASVLELSTLVEALMSSQFDALISVAADMGSALESIVPYLELLHKAENLLGNKFHRAFPSTMCRRDTKLGKLAFVVDISFVVVSPLSGTVIRVEETEIGAYVVISRTEAPLAHRVLRMGPLIIDGDFSLHSSLAAGSLLGRISPGASNCDSGFELTLELLNESLEPVLEDLIPYVRSPVMEDLTSQAKITSMVDLNIAFLQVSSNVIVNRKVIPESLLAKLGVPLSASSSNSRRRGSQECSDVSTFDPTSLDISLRDSLYRRDTVFFEQEFPFQVGPIPLVLIVKLGGYLEIEGEVSFQVYDRVASGALLPSAAAVLRADVAVDLSIFRAGVGGLATIMQTTLVPRARVYVDWPLDLCLSVELTVLPLEINIDAWYAIKACLKGLPPSITFCSRRSVPVAHWSAPTRVYSLSNTCAGSATSRRRSASARALGAPGMTYESRPASRDATDSIRASEPPKANLLQIRAIDGESGFVFEFALDVVSDSPVVAEYSIVNDPSVVLELLAGGNSDSFTPLSPALTGIAVGDFENQKLKFPKIYYMVFRVTNKEGMDSIFVSDPISIPPPSTLDYSHKLVLPPDSPGRHIFDSTSYLPVVPGKPFVYHMQMSVVDGDLQSFDSIVNFITDHDISGVDKTTVNFADHQDILPQSRSVLWQNGPKTSNSEPRFRSTDESVFVVGLFAPNFDAGADDDIDVRYGIIPQDSELERHCLRFGASRCSSEKWASHSLEFSEGAKPGGGAFLLEPGQYLYQGSIVDHAPSDISAFGVLDGGALCCRDNIDISTLPVFLRTSVLWADAEEFCWKHAFGRSLCRSTFSIRAKSGRYWLSRQGHYIEMPKGSLRVTRKSVTRMGVACCWDYANSTMYSLSEFGEVKNAEIRIQTTSSFPRKIPHCAEGINAENDGQCYYHWSGALFSAALAEYSRPSMVRFGVDSTPPLFSSNAFHILDHVKIPFAFGIDVFGNVDRYGGFSASVFPCPTCDVSMVNSLAIINHSDRIDVVLTHIFDLESGTPKIEFELFETCGDEANESALDASSWCLASHWIVDHELRSSKATFSVTKNDTQALIAGRGYVIRATVYNGAGFAVTEITPPIVIDTTPPENGPIFLANEQSQDTQWIRDLDQIRVGVFLGCTDWSPLGTPERLVTAHKGELPIKGDWFDLESAIVSRKIELLSLTKDGSVLEVLQDSFFDQVDSSCLNGNQVVDLSIRQVSLLAGASTIRAKANLVCEGLTPSFRLCDPLEALYGRWVLGANIDEGWTAWFRGLYFEAGRNFTTNETMVPFPPKRARRHLPFIPQPLYPRRPNTGKTHQALCCRMPLTFYKTQPVSNAFQARQICETGAAQPVEPFDVVLENHHLCTEFELRERLDLIGYLPRVELPDEGFWVQRDDNIGWVTKAPQQGDPLTWPSEPPSYGLNQDYPGYCCADRQHPRSRRSSLIVRPEKALISKFATEEVSVLPQSTGDLASHLEKVLEDQRYQIRISATNSAGLTSSNKSRVFAIDPIPPHSFSRLIIADPLHDQSVIVAGKGPTSISVLSDPRRSALSSLRGLNFTWDVSDWDSGLSHAKFRAWTGQNTLEFQETHFSASRVWISPNLTDLDHHFAVVQMQVTAYDNAGNNATEGRVIRVDHTPPNAYPIDPIPAVFHCTGRRLVSEGIPGETIEIRILLENCPLFGVGVSVPPSEDCIATLDILEYGGIQNNGSFQYQILFPDENNGEAAVQFLARAHRDSSLYPTTAVVGVTFLCRTPRFHFTLARCRVPAGAYEGVSEVSELLMAHNCPSIAPPIDTMFLSTEQVSSTQVVWSYAWNFPTWKNLKKCSVFGSSDALPDDCLPNAPWNYASSVLSVVSSNVTTRRLDRPFTRYGFDQLQPSSESGKYHVQRYTPVEVQAIYFRWADSTSASKVASLGFPAQPREGPYLGVMVDRGGHRVFFPLRSDIGRPLVIDTPRESLDLIWVGISDPESGLLPFPHAAIFDVEMETLPSNFPGEIYSRFNPAAFSRNDLRLLKYQLPRKSYLPGGWYFRLTSAGLSASSGFGFEGPLSRRFELIGSSDDILLNFSVPLSGFTTDCEAFGSECYKYDAVDDLLLYDGDGNLVGEILDQRVDTWLSLGNLSSNQKVFRVTKPVGDSLGLVRWSRLYLRGQGVSSLTVTLQQIGHPCECLGDIFGDDPNVPGSAYCRPPTSCETPPCDNRCLVRNPLCVDARGLSPLQVGSSGFYEANCVNCQCEGGTEPGSFCGVHQGHFRGLSWCYVDLSLPRCVGADGAHSKLSRDSPKPWAVCTPQCTCAPESFCGSSYDSQGKPLCRVENTNCLMENGQTPFARDGYFWTSCKRCSCVGTSSQFGSCGLHPTPTTAILGAPTGAQTPLDVKPWCLAASGGCVDAFGVLALNRFAKIQCLPCVCDDPCIDGFCRVKHRNCIGFDGSPPEHVFGVGWVATCSEARCTCDTNVLQRHWNRVGNAALGTCAHLHVEPIAPAPTPSPQFTPEPREPIDVPKCAVSSPYCVDIMGNAPVVLTPGFFMASCAIHSCECQQGDVNDHACYESNSGSGHSCAVVDSNCLVDGVGPTKTGQVAFHQCTRCECADNCNQGKCSVAPESNCVDYLGKRPQLVGGTWQINCKACTCSELQLACGRLNDPLLTCIPEPTAGGCESSPGKWFNPLDSSPITMVECSRLCECSLGSIFDLTKSPVASRQNCSVADSKCMRPQRNPYNLGPAIMEFPADLQCSQVYGTLVEKFYYDALTTRFLNVVGYRWDNPCYDEYGRLPRLIPLLGPGYWILSGGIDPSHQKDASCFDPSTHMFKKGPNCWRIARPCTQTSCSLCDCNGPCIDGKCPIRNDRQCIYGSDQIDCILCECRVAHSCNFDQFLGYSTCEAHSGNCYDNIVGKHVEPGGRMACEPHICSRRASPIETTCANGKCRNALGEIGSCAPRYCECDGPCTDGSCKVIPDQMCVQPPKSADCDIVSSFHFGPNSSPSGRWHVCVQDITSPMSILPRVSVEFRGNLDIRAPFARVAGELEVHGFLKLSEGHKFELYDDKPNNVVRLRARQIGIAVGAGLYLKHGGRIELQPDAKLALRWVPWPPPEITWLKTAYASSEALHVFSHDTEMSYDFGTRQWTSNPRQVVWDAVCLSGNGKAVYFKDRWIYGPGVFSPSLPFLNPGKPLPSQISSPISGAVFWDRKFWIFKGTQFYQLSPNLDVVERVGMTQDWFPGFPFSLNPDLLSAVGVINNNLFFISGWNIAIFNGNSFLAPGVVTSEFTSTCTSCECAANSTCSPTRGPTEGVAQCETASTSRCVDDYGKRPLVSRGENNVITRFAQCRQCECVGPCNADGTCYPLEIGCYDASGTYIKAFMSASCTPCSSNSPCTRNITVVAGEAGKATAKTGEAVSVTPSWDIKTSDTRFTCVDSKGLLPLPRSNPGRAQCSHPCVCRTDHLCAFHLEGNSPRPGEPWCFAQRLDCIDMYSQLPKDGKIPCEEPIVVTQMHHKMSDLSSETMFEVVELPKLPSRSLLISVNTSDHSDPRIADMFFDFEACVSNGPVTDASERDCQITLNPATSSSATALGSPQVEVMQGHAWSLAFNRKMTSSQLMFRSENVATFQIGFESDTGPTQTLGPFLFDPNVREIDLHATNATFDAVIPRLLHVIPISLREGHQWPARMSSLDVVTEHCSPTTDPKQCFFGGCMVPEMCGGQGMTFRVRTSVQNGALSSASTESQDILSPASNELYQPIDYSLDPRLAQWFAEAKNINLKSGYGDFQAWSSAESEQVLRRPTHYTDPRREKRFRFAEILCKVGVTVGSISHYPRDSDFRLSDGYEYNPDLVDNVNNLNTFHSSSMLQPLIRVASQDLGGGYIGESQATFDSQQPFDWFDDTLLEGGADRYGENLAKLLLSPGELSKILRVEVFNSLLVNDNSTLPTLRENTRIFQQMNRDGGGALIWPPRQANALRNSSVIKLCHVMPGYRKIQDLPSRYVDSRRGDSIVSVVWNEWFLRWERYPVDVFAGYEVFSDRVMYCHLSQLRQTNYIRVVDPILIPHYRFLSPPLPARGDYGFDRVDPVVCGVPGLQECNNHDDTSCHNCRRVDPGRLITQKSLDYDILLHGGKIMDNLQNWPHSLPENCADGPGSVAVQLNMEEYDVAFSFSEIQESVSLLLFSWPPGTYKFSRAPVLDCGESSGISVTGTIVHLLSSFTGSLSFAGPIDEFNLILGSSNKRQQVQLYGKLILRPISSVSTPIVSWMPTSYTPSISSVPSPTYTTTSLPTKAPTTVQSNETTFSLMWFSIAVGGALLLGIILTSCIACCCFRCKMSRSSKSQEFSSQKHVEKQFHGSQVSLAHKGDIEMEPT